MDSYILLFVTLVTFIGFITSEECSHCYIGFDSFGIEDQKYFSSKFFTRYGRHGDPMGPFGVPVRYGDYFGFAFRQNVTFTDVCFYTHCVSSYRVIVYNKKWQTLFDKEIDITQYGLEFDYFSSCLSIDYHTYVDFCVNDARYVRVFFFMRHNPAFNFFQDPFLSNGCYTAKVKQVKAKGCIQNEITSTLRPKTTPLPVHIPNQDSTREQGTQISSSDNLDQ